MLVAVLCDGGALSAGGALGGNFAGGALCCKCAGGGLGKLEVEAGADAGGCVGGGGLAGLGGWGGTRFATATNGSLW